VGDCQEVICKATCPGYLCGFNHDSLSYCRVPLSLPPHTSWNQQIRFFFLEFWFVHEQISRVLREVGDFWLRDAVRRLVNWGCSKKFMRYVLVNGSSDQYGKSLGPNGWMVNTFLSFLSWVSKTQPNHWTKRMANTRLATQDPRTCPGPEDRSVS